MFTVFLCSRLLSFCRDYVFVAICAVFGGFICGTATAAPGQLDPTFGANGLSVVPIFDPSDPLCTVGCFLQQVSAIARSDGRMLVVGSCQLVYSHAICVSQLLANGALDVSYGFNGITIIRGTRAWSPAKAALQSDGKLVVAAACPNPSDAPRICVFRLLQAGAIDTTFGVNGWVYVENDVVQDETVDVGTTTGDKIVVVASCGKYAYLDASDFCVARLLSDGSLDTSFGLNGYAMTPVGEAQDQPTSLKIDSSGRLLVAGWYGAVRTGWSSPAIVRYTPDGSLDSSFGFGGRLLRSAAPGLGLVDVQPDGRLVTFGGCGEPPTYHTCIGRFSASGALDTSFGLDGFQHVSLSRANALLALGDEYIVTVGWCEGSYPPVRMCVDRFTRDGQVDTSFGNRAAIDLPSSAYPDAALATHEGKVIVVGRCLFERGEALCLVRLKGGPYNPLSCALNADANPTIDPATDATLVTRYLLGFRGDALTTGALGQSPTRTGQALEDHLASLNLDADGDGQALAMTDGLLMLRAMLGLTGTALTHGATNASHPNVRNAQQILTWIENTHGVACLP